MFDLGRKIASDRDIMHNLCRNIASDLDIMYNQYLYQCINLQDKLIDKLCKLLCKYSFEYGLFKNELDDRSLHINKLEKNICYELNKRKDFHKELIEITWHPSRYWDWCYSEDEKNEIEKLWS